MLRFSVSRASAFNTRYVLTISELRQGSRHLSGCFPKSRKACRHLSFSFYTYLYMVCRAAHSSSRLRREIPQIFPNLPNLFFHHYLFVRFVQICKISVRRTLSSGRLRREIIQIFPNLPNHFFIYIYLFDFLLIDCLF